MSSCDTVARGRYALALALVEQDMAARRLAPGTRTATRAALKDFFRWLSRRRGRSEGAGDLAFLSRKDLVHYQAWLARQRSKKSGELLTAKTISNRFRSVSRLFSILYRSGVIAQNPVHGLVPAPAGPRFHSRRPLMREEITRFLEELDPSTPQGLKDRCLFELIYSSGLRVAEAAGLSVGDIDFERRVMRVRGKADRDRVVPISQVACDFLRLFLGPRIEDAAAWVFTSSTGPQAGERLRSTGVSERFRTLLRRFDMDKADISTHSIRHSTATHLLENGASVRHVQELLGHRSIESTVRYTHVMTDALCRIYRKHHPREHELFETVDALYDTRLETILAPSKKR